MTSNDFENLAAIVLEDKYKRPFHVYKKGKDGGIDCEASNIGMLINEKIIVQVKHTSNELETLKDGTRRSVFEKEKRKVERLVQEKKLDKYVIFTNYQLPAGQSSKLKEHFGKAGAKIVEVVGYETLCLWLSASPSLKGGLIAIYPDIMPDIMPSTTINQSFYYEDGPSGTKRSNKDGPPPNEDGPSGTKRSKSEPDLKGIQSRTLGTMAASAPQNKLFREGE